LTTMTRAKTLALLLFLGVACTACDEASCDEETTQEVDARVAQCAFEVEAACKGACDMLYIGDTVCLDPDSPCDDFTRDHLISLCYDTCEDPFRRVDYAVACEAVIQ